jgi:hypothetical protein
MMAMTMTTTMMMAVTMTAEVAEPAAAAELVAGVVVEPVALRHAPTMMTARAPGPRHAARRWRRPR